MNIKRRREVTFWIALGILFATVSSYNDLVKPDYWGVFAAGLAILLTGFLAGWSAKDPNYK